MFTWLLWLYTYTIFIFESQFLRQNPNSNPNKPDHNLGELTDK